MNASRRPPFPVVTVTLIGICVAVSLMSGLGANEAVLRPLLIAEPGYPMFAQIASGQLWRLVTPMFVHFGILHIIFNMMWLWDLGRALEYLKSRAFLVVFVLVSGVAANVAQYVITGQPVFGGMSGVVYALLGYVWIQGRYNPSFGFALHQSTVIMMLAWFVICWTGIVGPIANWAHTAGLVIGVAWGFIGHKPRRRTWTSS
jgi:GlpG protein